MIKEYIKEMLEDDYLGLLNIKGGGDQETAEKIANKLKCAVGVTKFLNGNGDFSYGILIDKRKIKNEDGCL